MTYQPHQAEDVSLKVPPGDPGKDCLNLRACLNLPIDFCVCLKHAKKAAKGEQVERQLDALGQVIERDGYGPRTPLRWPFRGPDGVVLPDPAKEQP